MTFGANNINIKLKTCLRIKQYNLVLAIRNTGDTTGYP